MKYKKLIIILSIFIIAFIYIIHPIIEDKYLLNHPYNDDIIRFHVRANSDTKEDQELKLKVRDELLEVMTEKFENSSSIDESRRIVKENIDEIKSISEKVIKENNKDYSVNVFFGIDYFPIRKYGNMVFPQGNYETLLVTIGEGKGQNWWCVMFPPICFVDITHSHAIETEGELDKYIIDENQPLKLKSKTAELINKLKPDKAANKTRDSVVPNVPFAVPNEAEKSPPLNPRSTNKPQNTLTKPFRKPEILRKHNQTAQLRMTNTVLSS